MPSPSQIMRRAWSLFRQSMVLRFDRVALAAHLRQARTEARIAATYTAKRVGAGFVLKRNGVQFGRLTGLADALTFTTTDEALA